MHICTPAASSACLASELCLTPSAQCTVMSGLLYSGEAWAVVNQYISPLAAFQTNCLRCICGISLGDHVPNVVILNRCNILCVESQLQSKNLSQLGHTVRVPNDRLLRKLCLVKSGVFVKRALQGAQDRLLWRDKTCPACTQSYCYNRC